MNQVKRGAIIIVVGVAIVLYVLLQYNDHDGGELVTAGVSSELDDDTVVRVLSRDAIPAIFEPEFVTASEAKIEPDAFVIGFVHGGEARAYSLSLLNSHEIVNDIVGGEPIAATWCPLCFTAIVYSRKIEDKTLTLGVSGMLWRNALVMYDRETETLWSHVTGESIEGKLKGKQLTMMVATPRVKWSEWQKTHPQTKVLSMQGRQEAPYDRYAGYHDDQGRAGVVNSRFQDTRLPPKDLVVGIALGRVAMAFPHRRLRKNNLISAKIGETPVLVWFKPETGATAIFRAPQNGKYYLIDDQIAGPRGNRWIAMTGTGIGASKSLEPLPHTNAYWFGWVAYYPNTKLYDD